jgi:molecular chaperone HtpG
MSSFLCPKKTLELNPNHPIIIELQKKVDLNKKDKTVKDLVLLLFDTALLCSGFALEDPSAFASRIHRKVKLVLSIDDEVQSEEEEVSLEAADDESAMEEVD